MSEEVRRSLEGTLRLRLYAIINVHNVELISSTDRYFLNKSLSLLLVFGITSRERLCHALSLRAFGQLLGAGEREHIGSQGHWGWFREPHTGR